MENFGSVINILVPQHWFRQNALFVVLSIRIRNRLDFHFALINGSDRTLRGSSIFHLHF